MNRQNAALTDRRDARRGTRTTGRGGDLEHSQNHTHILDSLL